LRKTPQKIAATRAALLDSNTHQIICWLGLCPRPHWGSLQRSPRPLAVFRGLLLREGREEEGRSRAEEETGGIGTEERVGEGGESRKGVGKEGNGPHDSLAWGLPMS